MPPAIDYQNLPKTQRQNIVSLLDQLAYLSTTLQEMRRQKRALFEQKQILFERLHVLSEMQQTLCIQESTLVKEESAILAQLSCLREYN